MVRVGPAARRQTVQSPVHRKQVCGGDVYVVATQQRQFYVRVSPRPGGGAEG